MASSADHNVRKCENLDASISRARSELLRCSNLVCRHPRNHLLRHRRSAQNSILLGLDIPDCFSGSSDLHLGTAVFSCDPHARSETTNQSLALFSDVWRDLRNDLPVFGRVHIPERRLQQSTPPPQGTPAYFAAYVCRQRCYWRIYILVDRHRQNDGPIKALT